MKSAALQPLSEPLDGPGGVHPTAIVHPSARIDPSAAIGPYTVVGEEVSIGRDCRIGSHCVIEFARIGRACRIHSHAFIGTAPQDLKYRGEKTKIVIGEETIVRECATLNRGTAQSGRTLIGSRCLLMAYSHVAHDCRIGDEVILANSVAVAGHVTVGGQAVIGGLAGIHQFVQIGRLAMIGAGAMVPTDVPPFCIVSGDRARIIGLNLEGLKRRRIDAAAVEALKAAYRRIFFSGKPMRQTLKQMRSEKIKGEEVREFLGFLAGSSRGICRPRLKAEAGAAQIW